MIASARAFNITGIQRQVYVVRPRCCPGCSSRCESPSRSALILMTSEMVSLKGPGFVITQAQATFQLLTMWSGILMLGILQFLMIFLYSMVERRLLRSRRPAALRHPLTPPSAPYVKAVTDARRFKPRKTYPVGRRVHRPRRRHVLHRAGGRAVQHRRAVKVQEEPRCCAAWPDLDQPTSGSVTFNGQRVDGPPANFAVVFRFMPVRCSRGSPSRRTSGCR